MSGKQDRLLIETKKLDNFMIDLMKLLLKHNLRVLVYIRFNSL